MKVHILAHMLAITALFGLAGCDALHPKPKDSSFEVIAAPPAKAVLALYPGTERVGVEARSGACDSDGACQVWQNGKWAPLPADQAAVLPLLAITQPAEGGYSDGLWRRIDSSDRAVLINSEAGANNVAAGKFDGLRIGLKAAGRTTYVTTYGLENGRLTGVQGDVFIANGTAWLLHRRPDGSAVLADVFAQWNKGGIVCLPGLALDTAGQWAGPPEQALSPDIYLSRRTDTPENADDAAHMKQVLATCAGAAKA